MNSRQLWNWHQRHKFLRTKASRDILKFRVSEMAFQGIFTADAMLFHQHTRNTGNNAIEMFQAFHDIARFKCFTDLNLVKYAFNVIQNWNTDALQFYFIVLIFGSGYCRRR